MVLGLYFGSYQPRKEERHTMFGAIGFHWWCGFFTCVPSLHTWKKDRNQCVRIVKSNLHFRKYFWTITGTYSGPFLLADHFCVCTTVVESVDMLFSDELLSMFRLRVWPIVLPHFLPFLQCLTGFSEGVCHWGSLGMPRQVKMQWSMTNMENNLVGNLTGQNSTEEPQSQTKPQSGRHRWSTARGSQYMGQLVQCQQSIWKEQKESSGRPHQECPGWNIHNLTTQTQVQTTHKPQIKGPRLHN